MTPSLGAWLILAAEVRWTAPAGCPSEAAVRARLGELVGPDALHPDVVADARVQSSADGWVLSLDLRTGPRSSARRMVSDDCRTLADAVALVVATFVDPVVVSTQASRASPALPEPSPQPDLRESLPAASSGPSPAGASSPSVSSSSSSGSPAPRAVDRWGWHVGVLAGRATLHDLDLGPDLALSWQRGAVRLALGALFLVPRDRPVSAGVVLRQWMVAGRLRAGVVMPLSARVELPLSIGAELGPVVARGRGITTPRTVVSPWLAGLGSVHLLWRPRARWGLWVGVDGVMGVLLPQFTVGGVGPLRAGSGGVRASLGMAMALGGRS
ncbi:MAG: hypothetical protein AAGF11_05160 [Myxococcota bacterium]